jgi:pimeloyl-ACP methyl ester carboxylesterase
MPTTMPAVFVHGVPDTSRVWHAVIARLPRPDVVTLSLPGFGRPAPDGFDATTVAYVRTGGSSSVRPDAVAAELDRFWARI